MFWEKKTKIRKHIIFYGRVQGVGFRYYAVQKANQLGLTGWVKNLYDGSVVSNSMRSRVTGWKKQST